VGKKSLMNTYPALYNITRKKNVTVASVLSTVPLNVTFRRALTGVNLKNWLKLVESVIAVRLSDQDDVFVCNNSKKGYF
jgi:hypothetical protein